MPGAAIWGYVPAGRDLTMKQDSQTPRASTGFAVFDDAGKLLAANAALTGLTSAENEALTGKSKTHFFKFILK